MCIDSATIVKSWIVRKHVDGHYSCSCQQLTRLGLPCSHILKVLSHKNVKVFPKSIQQRMKAWSTLSSNGASMLKMIFDATKANDNNEDSSVAIKQSNQDICSELAGKLTSRFQACLTASRSSPNELESLGRFLEMWMHDRNKKREEARQEKLNLTQQDGIETRGPQDAAGLSAIVTAKPSSQRTSKRRYRSNVEKQKTKARKKSKKQKTTTTGKTKQPWRR